MRELRHVVPIFIALGFGLAATPLSAKPASIKDCEKIQAADAYNQCLASFGPVAHEHALKPVPPNADRLSYAFRHRSRHVAVITRHRRRKRMLISVGPRNNR